MKEYCAPRPVMPSPATMADLVEHALELTMVYQDCSAKNTAKANAFIKLEHDE